jgi:hypothetical protein
MKRWPAFLRTPYLFAGCLSILLSAFINLRESVINPDAICYLLSAAAVADSINAAMQLCGQATWPFYSVLIYTIARLTHLSYQNAAYILDGCFTLLSVLTFIAIVAELGGKRVALYLAAAVILLHHDFNSVRQYIIRDHGFWAFYLLSLYALLKFSARPGWRYALCFSASILIATLFRIEGAVFLLVLPWLMLFKKGGLKARLWSFSMLQTLPILLLVGLAVWVMLHPQHTAHQFGRLPELIKQGQSAASVITERFIAAKQGMAEHVLTYDSAPEAGKLLILLLAIWYGLLIIGSLSLAFTLIIGYGLYAGTIKLPQHAKLVLFGYLVINLMITVGFFLEHFFLSKRYVLAFSLTLLLLVPLILARLYAERQHLKARMLLAMFFAAILLCAAGGIFDFGYSKSYIHEAGSWIKAQVPKKAALYVNDIQLMYYSAHFGNSVFVKERLYGKLSALAGSAYQQYDYLALRLDKKSEPEAELILANASIKRVKVFFNKRGDRVVIYKVRHEA